MIRLGIVPYLNAFPYLYGLQRTELDFSVEISFAHPTQLNAQLARGELEAALISSIEYARHWQNYTAVSSLGIGTRGSAGSVLFFSRLPIQQLSGGEIGLTHASATGGALLHILLERYWGVSGTRLVPFSDLEQAEEQFSSFLLIGDLALEFQQKLAPGDPWQGWDLGKIWRDWSGLAFVFALWTVRSEWVRKNPAKALSVGENLKKAISIAEQDPLAVIQEAKRRWKKVEHIEKYLGQFDYLLSQAHWDGLVSFYQWAKRFNEIERVPDLDPIKGEVHV